MDTVEEDAKRLFFGAQIAAPWPKELPKARMIPEETRHMTLAFLGQNSIAKIRDLFPALPLPAFKIGPAGICQELVFLPPEKSRVVAAAAKWLDETDPLTIYQNQLAHWLRTQGYSIDKRPFFPHITIGRAPFDPQQWKDQFSPLPFFVKAIHLYQSLGNLHYESLWESPLLPPFEEFEHTADIAFLIRGTSCQDLHRHAQVALAFKYPKLIEYFSDAAAESLDEIIISLNEMIAKVDIAVGSPFKAVSFHGKIKTDAQNILQWEMIVDV